MGVRGCDLRNWSARIAALLLMAFAVRGQSVPEGAPQPGALAQAPGTAAVTRSGASSVSAPAEPPAFTTVRQHWDFFLQETFGPISLAGTIFNAGFSQVTNSDPQYGKTGIAFAQRVGASAADIGAQNFFGDFLVASALHEDPRYVRRGEQYGFWNRFGYAISRALVIRTSSGGTTFNWDNVLGSGMSAGFSNLYYPPPSRNKGAMFIHFGTSVADNGFVNLAPEFWPDFRRKLFGRHHKQ